VSILLYAKYFGSLRCFRCGCNEALQACNEPL
jgi:hypothetical protein